MPTGAIGFFPMTFLKAAEEVLRKSKRPLTGTEITELAMREGLITTRGKTPEATMLSALYTARAKARVKRISQQGPRRAVRGSVRWTYVERSREG
jgi:hypothetical protein